MNEIEKAMRYIADIQLSEEDTDSRKILDLAFQALQEKQEREWISVEDRLPNTDVRVLVALISKNGNKGIDDCFYSFKKNKFLLYSTLEEVPNEITVTHWQPLPEPPKEREENE